MIDDVPGLPVGRWSQAGSDLRQRSLQIRKHAPAARAGKASTRCWNHGLLQQEGLHASGTQQNNKQDV